MGRLRLAQCLRAAGRDVDGARELRQVLDLDENFWFSHFLQGVEHALDGKLTEALPYAEKAYALAPWSTVATGVLAAVLRCTGNSSAAEGLLEKLRPGHAYGAPIALASYHFVCSELDETADWTEEAIAQRHPAVAVFLSAHAQALRSTSRWPALARLMKLPE
jgi:tetratricopeptide (TPR) repeat protein